MHELILENRTVRAAFLPAYGGRMARLQFKADAGATDVLAPYTQRAFDPLAWPKCGMYPLAPYANRIRHARLCIGGETWRLPPHPAAAPHTLHGCAHTLPWQVSAQDEQSLTMAVEYAGAHWPWRFKCVQHVQLAGSGIAVRLDLINLDRLRAMPAGAGLHPFLATAGLEEVRFHAGRRWPHMGDCLPDGSYSTERSPQSWRKSHDGGRDLLAYYSHWHGSVDLLYHTGILTMQADPGTRHLVLYAPPAADYLCIEPVTHLANAFALPQVPASETGIRMLEPGEHMSVQLSLHWFPAAQPRNHGVSP